MARIDTLNNFLTDVASAIKDKKGDTTPIKASDFDTEIENLPTGGENTYKIDANSLVELYCTSTVEKESDTEISNDVNTLIGHDVFAFLSVRSPLLSVTEGWELVNEPNSTPSGDLEQTTYIYHKISNKKIEEFSATQETANRFFLIMLSFDNKYHFAYNIEDFNVNAGMPFTDVKKNNFLCISSFTANTEAYYARDTFGIDGSYHLISETTTTLRFGVLQILSEKKNVKILSLGSIDNIAVNKLNFNGYKNLTEEEYQEYCNRELFCPTADSFSTRGSIIRPINSENIDLRYFIYQPYTGFKNTSGYNRQLSQKANVKMMSQKQYVSSPNVASLASMFASNYLNGNVFFEDMYFKLCDNISNMFYHSNSVNKISLKNTILNVSTCSFMFSNCSNLYSIDISSLTNKENSSASGMFSETRTLTQIDMRSFLFTNLTSYSSMFTNIPGDCLIIVKDNEQKNWLATNFSNLSFVKTVDELNEPINLDRKYYMASLKYYVCWGSLTNGPGSSAKEAFMGCSNMKEIDMRNFLFTNLTEYTDMFTRTKSDCLIIVKDDEQKQWITSRFTSLTNVKTVDEIEE